MNLKKRLLPLCSYALLAALLTGVAASGLLSSANNALADRLFQHPSALSGEVVLIGIDQTSLEELGPWPWPRTVLAQALDILNRNPETRPAVIGLDALFVSETTPDADAALQKAAARYRNVVTASAATFGSEVLPQEDGSFHLNNYAISSYDEPFAALREVTDQGHINAMLDTDGILRHAIWQIDLPDGRTIPSFHQQIYRKYLQSQGLDASFAPPTDSRHRWYVPMQALPGGFDDGFSVSSLLRGDLDPDLFAGKIVLIGPFAIGLHDSYPTSIDHASPMFGVEYQANAISALLAGESKKELPPTPQWIALFFLLFAVLLFLHNRKVLPATIFAFGLSLASLLCSMLLYQKGFVLNVLYLPLFLFLCYIGSVVANYIRETMEKHRVTATFERYVAPEIVSELLRGDPAALELGGKLCDVAVLFVDIRGFTALSEGLPPGTVVDIINRYLSLTAQCIFHNGGTLDKYIGDCTMAIWGAPLPREDSAFHAVKAAMDMVDGAEALGEELRRRYGRTVGFGIGVHFGPAVVGNIGSPTRMDYTAIGDTVNTAARLEENAPGGQIYVSRAIADQLNGRIRFSSLGNQLPLKGKTEGFEVLRVEGLSPAAQIYPPR